MVELKDRLKELRLTMKMSQEDFGAQLGIKKSAISYLESGKSQLTDRNAAAICEKFNVRREWLLEGKGEMFGLEEDAPLNVIVQRYDLNSFETAMLERYLQLSKPERELFMGLLQKIVGESAALSGGAAETAANKEGSVAAAEAAYEKNLGFAPSADATASNTTGGTASTDETG
jgi:transcriptional regulator with XRE-family HTH domain